MAIGLVVWHHATMAAYPKEADYWSGSASQLGAFGVDIFFALSGLLITTLLLREADEGQLSLRRFYVRRVFRIFPPLLAFLGFAVMLGRIQPGWELLSSVFLFRNYLPSALAGHASGHLWSLSIEEHFYLLWPGFLALVALGKGPRLVAYLAIAAGLWRIADAENGLTTAWLRDLPPHFRTDLRLDALLWGCFAAFLLNDAKTRELVRAKVGQGWFAGLAALAMVGTVIYSYLSGLWLAMLLPMLLLLTLLHPEWAVSRALDWAPVRFMGRISYSLYLWQQLFLVPGWLPGGLGFPLNVCLAFGAAVLSHYCVERPCIAFGRRLAARLTDTAARGRMHPAAQPEISL